MDDTHTGQAEELQITAAIRRRIQREITDSGLQDPDIAERTGLSASQVGRMRRGEADNLTVKSLVRLSKAFGKPPEYWLSGQAAERPTDNQPDKPEHELLASSGIQSVLLRGVFDLDQQAQLEIVRFVDSVRRLRGMTEVAGDADD
ncbi:XRE family transcriptional regulator [Nonomuraea sp. NPDC023979]|uniref:XRE family transcriptional regulator n=1 Tax=Nonomuraea sp. NPDC023979 TaxID=3154796 RepID=UPI0033F0A580